MCFLLEASNMLGHHCVRNCANMTKDKPHYALIITLENSTQDQRCVFPITGCKMSLYFQFKWVRDHPFSAHSSFGLACLQIQWHFVTKEIYKWIFVFNSCCGTKYSYVRTERISEECEKCKTLCPEGATKINCMEESYIQYFCYL